MAKMKTRQLNNYQPKRMESIQYKKLPQHEFESNLKRLFSLNEYLNTTFSAPELLDDVDKPTNPNKPFIPFMCDVFKTAGESLNWDYLSDMNDDENIAIGTCIDDRYYRDAVKMASHEINNIKIGGEYFDKYGIKTDAHMRGNVPREDVLKTISECHPNIFDKDGKSIDSTIMSDYTRLVNHYSSRRLNPDHPDDVLSHGLSKFIEDTGLYRRVHTVSGKLDDNKTNPTKLGSPFRIITVPQTDLNDMVETGFGFYSNTFGDSIKDMISKHPYLAEYINAQPIKGASILTGIDSHNLGVIAKPVLNPEYFSPEQQTEFINYVKCRATGAYDSDIPDVFDKFMGNEDVYPVMLNIYVPMIDDESFALGQLLHIIALVDEILQGTSMFKWTSDEVGVKTLSMNSVVTDIDIMEYFIHGLVSEIRHDVYSIDRTPFNEDKMNKGRSELIYGILTHNTLTNSSNFSFLSGLLSGVCGICTGSSGGDAMYYPRQVMSNQYRKKGGITSCMFTALGGENVIDKILSSCRHIGHTELCYGTLMFPGNHIGGTFAVDYAQSSQILKALNFSLYSTSETADSFMLDKLVSYFGSTKSDGKYDISRAVERIIPNNRDFSKNKALAGLPMIASGFSLICNISDIVTGVSSTTMTSRNPKYNESLMIAHDDMKEITSAINSPLWDTYTFRLEHLHYVGEDVSSIINYLFRKTIISVMGKNKQLMYPKNTFAGYDNHMDLEAVVDTYEAFADVIELESLASMIAVTKHGYSEEELNVCIMEVHQMMNNEDRYMTLHRISKNMTKANKKLKATSDAAEKSMIEDFIDQLKALQKTCRNARIVKAHNAPLISFSDEATSDINSILDETFG